MRPRTDTPPCCPATVRCGQPATYPACDVCVRRIPYSYPLPMEETRTVSPQHHLSVPSTDTPPYPSVQCRHLTLRLHSRKGDLTCRILRCRSACVASCGSLPQRGYTAVPVCLKRGQRVGCGGRHQRSVASSGLGPSLGFELTWKLPLWEDEEGAIGLCTYPYPR